MTGIWFDRPKTAYGFCVGWEIRSNLYVLLTGAKKNAGDFLIAHSAKTLLRHFHPNEELVEMPSWKPVDDQLDTINQASALILCGGPSISPELGGRIYPILDVLDQIRTPTVAFGVGWHGIPGDDRDVLTYQLPPRSVPLLARIADDFPFAGCRDFLTWRILRRYRVNNALMTGCPSWHDPAYISEPFTPPANIADIVFSPPAPPLFGKQCVDAMKMTRKMFPEARIVCSFHRGLTEDQYTSAAEARFACWIKQESELVGLTQIDISGSVDGLLDYRDFDVHIGYRVHGHLKMLSMRKPSFLLAEDGRGRGALEAMGLPGVMAWKVPQLYSLAESIAPSVNFRRIRSLFLHPCGVNPNAVPQMRSLLEEESKNGFVRFQGAIRAMQAAWVEMKRLIEEHLRNS